MLIGNPAKTDKSFILISETRTDKLPSLLISISPGRPTKLRSCIRCVFSTCCEIHPEVNIIIIQIRYNVKNLKLVISYYSVIYNISIAVSDYQQTHKGLIHHLCISQATTFCFWNLIAKFFCSFYPKFNSISCI